ncbi:hypothetical protein I4U23_004743 [Adineta vaga]|nr:hypothetical protein I4U23_004743 [Adineta vaga]
MKTFFDQPIPSDIYLSNIHYISIKLPLHNQFWSVISSFNHLNTLHISSYTDAYQSELQNLLDQAPNLYSLRINQKKSLPLQMSLFKLRHSSLYTIHFSELNYCFNEEECLIFCRSLFGIQCQLRLIDVKNRYCVITLVKKRINLQAAHVYCEEEVSDELTRCLKYYLSPTCFLTRDPCCSKVIRIWI